MASEEYIHPDDPKTLKSIIDNLTLFLFLLDKNRCFTATYNIPEDILGSYNKQDIVGKHLIAFAQDSTSPFYEACARINQVFDQVMNTGIPARIEYSIYDKLLEATVSKISNEVIMGQVRDITEIAKVQQSKEIKRQNELAMALTAGGIASWCYDVKADLITSTHQNNIIGASISRKELLKQIIPEHRNRFIKMYDDLLNKGMPHAKITLQAQNKQGEIRWYTLHAIPDSYFQDGSVSIIIGSQKDVTEEYHKQEAIHRNKEEAVAANKLLLALIDFIPCPLFIKDVENDFRYIIANKLFCKENNLPVEEIIGKNDFDICPTQEKALDLERQDKEALASTTFCTYTEHSISQSNGTEKIWQTTKAKFISKEYQQLLIGVMVDFTDQTNALKQMQAAKKLAERSDKLKSAFLANMSHEIRTPLNAIVGFSQLLTTSDDQTEQDLYIEIINNNSDQLLTLINDILDLSKIESGYIDCLNNFFPIDRLMSELEITFAPKIQTSVKLICTVPNETHLVNLDKRRVSQVMINFITNAIKFTSEGSIEFGYQLYKDGIKLFVKDTGSGIKEENLSKVFDRFEKFDLFKQGTGLGTSICKAIIDAYQGEIGVTSNVGEGSYFWAYIPTEIRSAE